MLVDEDYRVLGGHVDTNLRKKIVSNEYVDLAKLLPRDRVKSETDNRLEVMNKNGKTFWVPYADRENVTIYSYARWELAFRVFADIYTRHFPGKSGELLQYNHVIHSAVQSFSWDNVYTYDIDFRIHIS